MDTGNLVTIAVALIAASGTWLGIRAQIRRDKTQQHQTEAGIRANLTSSALGIVEALETRVERLEVEIESARVRVAALETELFSAKNEVTALKSELTVAKARIVRLDAELLEQKHRRQDLQDRVQGLEDRNGRLEAYLVENGHDPRMIP